MSFFYVVYAYLALGLLLALVSVVAIVKLPEPITEEEAQEERRVEALARLLRPWAGDAWLLVVALVIAVAWPWVVWRVLAEVLRRLRGRPGRHRA